MPGRTRNDLFDRGQPPEFLSQADEFPESMAFHRPVEKRLGTGLLTGLLAGAAATWVMTMYQVKAQEWMKHRPESVRQEQPTIGEHGGRENPTVALANRISSAVRGREVHDEHRELAGNLVHYAFGTLNGGLFGLISEFLPLGTPLRGLLYGAALWGAIDETALPGLGVAGRWRDYPTSVHANALGAHLVYGSSLDLLQRGLRALTDIGSRREMGYMEHEEPAEVPEESFRRPGFISQVARLSAAIATRRAGRFRPDSYTAEEAYERERPTGYRRAA